MQDALNEIFQEYKRQIDYDRFIGMAKNKKRKEGQRMDKIVEIDALEPHLTGELICIKCKYRYIGTWNKDVWLRALYCPKCKKSGYTIATGQILEHGDLSAYNKDNPRKMNKPGQVLNFNNLDGGI